VPADRERDGNGGGDGAPPPLDLVGDDSQSVGFLDLPDLDGDAVVGRVLAGFARLDAQAVLTAYCTRVDLDAMTDLCRPLGVDVVHSVSHEAGTTFVLKRISR